MKTTIKIAVIAMMGISLGIQSQTNHLDGQTKLINPGGRTLLIERNDNDSWLTFHDNGDSWYSMGIDRSNSGSFNINYGGVLNSSQFVMDRKGNVGIGTTSTSAKLDVADGNNQGTLYPVIRLTSKDVNAEPNQSLGEIQFYNKDADGAHISSFIKNIATETYGRKGVLSFGTSGVNSTNATEKMRLNEKGYLGIGTTNPKAKLDVNGIIQVGSRSATGGGIIIAQKYAGNDYIGTLSSNYSSGALIMGYGAAGMPNQGASGQLVSTFDNFNGFRSAIRVASGTFEFVSSPTKLQTTVGNQINVESRFFINNQGKVGIGTKTMGNHKLAVEGSIGAREIKVEVNGWSDFVFYEDYNLPTLKEVENHIKEKGHLKDIPSAKEVEKNGFFLGEMDAKLLQKIEELTLYTIEQEKKIKALEVEKVENEKQQKEIDELKALVQKLLKDKN